MQTKTIGRLPTNTAASPIYADFIVARFVPHGFGWSHHPAVRSIRSTITDLECLYTSIGDQSDAFVPFHPLYILYFGSAPLRADDQPVNENIIQRIYDTVSLGTRLYNDGQQESSYRRYQGTLMVMLPMLEGKPELQKQAMLSLLTQPGLLRCDIIRFYNWEIVMSRRVLVGILMAFLLLPIMGCKGTSKRDKFIKEMAQSQEKYKKLVTGQEIDGERAMEAKNFLQFTNTDCVLNNGNKKEMLGHVEDIYEAGSPKVMCCYVITTTIITAKNCKSIIVEMPKDAEARKAVLKKFAEMEKLFWPKATRLPDEGLQYLLLNLDP